MRKKIDMGSCHRMDIGWLALVLASSLALSAPAEEPAEQPMPGLDELRKKVAIVDEEIEALERKRDALTQEAEAAERLAEATEQLHELHQACREWIKEAENRETEMDQEDPPRHAAGKAFREALLKYLAERTALSRQILAITEVTRLNQAWDVNGRVAELAEQWDELQGPTLADANRAGDLELDLREEDTPERRATLLKFRKLAEENHVSRQQEYELRKARRLREKMMDELAGQF